MTHTPSPYQQAIYDAILHASDNLIIEAVAGSGKTTTIVNGIQQIDASKSRVFLAFNKSIAEELKRRGVPASTFHALALAGLRVKLPMSFKIDGYKVNSIFKTIVAKELQDDLAELPRLVGLGKNYGIGVFDDLPNEADSWSRLLEYHDLNFPEGAETKVCAFAKRILEISNQNREVIDFDDMLYLNLLLDAPADTYDFVFIDEAQDTNGIQQEFLRKLDNGATRFVFVGDRHQAIYGFRGAGTESMDIIRKRFHARALPLSVSYRCPREVVTYAKQFVSQIESHTSAIAGSVSTPSDWSLNDLGADSVVICRLNKPIIKLAYHLLRNGRRVQVLGRDIGAGFISLVKKAKALDMDALREKLERQRDHEAMRERQKGNEAKAAAIEDKFDSLLCILDALDPETPVASIPDEIDKLFRAQPGAVQLCSVHKSKGLEWDNVFILDRQQYMPSKWAREPWQLEQEYNLIYVAATRAKRNLAFIDSRTMKEE